MKNLHWNPVNPWDVQQTIWSNVSDDNVKFDTKQFESLFCWKEIEIKTPEKTENNDKPDSVRVLDSKRSYNVEIFLSQMKMDNWTVREAMLTLDDNVLPLDKINKFTNFVPTPEEAASLEGYDDEPNLAHHHNLPMIVLLQVLEQNLQIY